MRGVVNLYERDQVRVFVRREVFERFYSCLVYVPRDRYNTEVRARIESILRSELGGTHVETQVQLSESTLARLHVVVRTDPARRRRIELGRIERAVAGAATTWADRLRAELAKGMDESAALATAKRYAPMFPAAYTEDVEPQAALEDIAELEALQRDPQTLRLRLHRPPQQKAERVHLAIVKLGEPVPISDIMPMMENFGLRVIAERPYELAWPGGGSAWIQDFELEHRDAARIDLAARTAAAHCYPRRLARRDRERWLQPPAARSRARGARDRRAAHLLPLSAADRNSVQPGVYGTRARSATQRLRGTCSGCSPSSSIRPRCRVPRAAPSDFERRSGASSSA